MRYYRIAGVPERHWRFLRFGDLVGVLSDHAISSFRLEGRKWIAPAKTDGIRMVGGLFVFGPHDIGKTSLACLAMLALCSYLQEHPDPIFLHCGTYIASQRRSDGLGQRLFDHALSASVMILDDIGSESRTPFTMEQLNNLLDGRLGCGYPNIFTSNFSPRELEAIIDSRTVARILRGCTVVQLS